jgi:tungstate transport system substrate-binding protein
MRPLMSPPGIRRAASVALATALALSLAACSSAPANTALKPAEPVKKTDVILASTTSTQDSGLFDVLIPAFEKANPAYLMKVIAVGSGEAIKLGEQKDADVLLVHSPASEVKFMDGGFGVDRRPVMYNDFVIVGPAADPAGIKGAVKAVDAFAKMAAARAVFVSRGDDSGTHNKEKSIWASGTIDPKGQSWYLSVGQGMGETLKIANEKTGYTLVDRATWLTAKSGLDGLVLLVEGDKKLYNPYSVIQVVGAKNASGAKAFSDWIISADGQTVIGEFGKAKYGQQIFVPNATP